MQTPLTKPPQLCRGDKIATVTLSWGGPGAFPHRYEAGKKQLENQFGVQVVEMPNTLRDPKWIRANPKARADDLMKAFSDSSIKGIVSTIGGDDSVRILPHLDLEIIRNNPKVFMGYSDTTVTHFACLRAGLSSFYGPSIMAGFAENGGLHRYLVDSVRRTVFSGEAIGTITNNAEGWTVERLEWGKPELRNQKRKLNPPGRWNVLQGKGRAVGPLIGGCAEVMEFLKGTDFWPSPDQWDGAILFLETSEEAPSPTLFERWLRNFGSQGILQRLNGILLGRPGGDIAESDFEKYDAALIRVIRDELGLADLPIVTRMDFGHTDPMFVIPYGRQAEIDCAKGHISVLENAVL